MTLRAYIFGISAAVFVLAVVVVMLRRGNLRERHAIWWLGAGIAALAVSAAPQALSWAAGLVGIDLPVNLVFFVSIAILFLVSLQHSAELTRLESKVRDLAETVAILELKCEELASQSRARHPAQGPEVPPTTQS